ncbi:MAG: sigma-54 dependent transcriptional regulator [Thermodesulfobacteriota bacterium]
MAPHPRVLIVDDEAHIRKILTIMLTKKGYETQAAGSGQEALGLIRQAAFDAVITDLRMPGLDGLDLLREIKTQDPELVVIVITAFATVETAIAAMKQGAYDYISKPFKEDEILIVLDKALERQRILAENRQLRAQIREKYDFSNFIGRSRPMQRVLEIIAKVAETKATVLITGESGTGKELAARAIHQAGPRRDKPFVPINCGAVPANLLESEFFGYVKGAFSGADRPKKGLFAEADGGTLFLDEVSELPLEMQVKILRAIQEEEIRRLGEATALKVDLRIVAATNKDLPEEVKASRFREDLFYRLNVITLYMPPLRERPEDIPLLAHHFLNQVVREHKLEPKKLSPEAVRVLAAQPWPGNVRALRNAIEQSAVMSDGSLISVSDLPVGPAPISKDRSGLSVSVPEDWTDLKSALKSVIEQTEKIIIQRTLEKSDRNRTRAAQILGLSRRALITKVQAYGLE